VNIYADEQFAKQLGWEALVKAEFPDNARQA
jgi:hypothetical protein